MGIDKSNIRYVYHYNLPKSLENFSQEIGRAGRDGQPATCEMFVCPDDLNVLENFIYGDTPTLAAVRTLLEDLFARPGEFDVSIHELSAAHDIRLLVVRTLLVYLELDGYLKGGTPFYSIYQFKPLATSAAILDRFDGERRRFLKGLFCQARKAKTWLHVDTQRASTALRCGRDRIVRALDYLGQQGLLEVRSAGVRLRYQRIRTPDDAAALARTLHQRMGDREARELGRLGQVLELARTDGCQVSALGAHFGQPLVQPCGHCSRCLADRPSCSLPGRSEPDVDPEVWQQGLALRRAHGDVLADARSLTRLLCGISSPRLVRAKLTRDPLFGALAHVPFQRVLERAETAAG